MVLSQYKSNATSIIDDNILKQFIVIQDQMRSNAKYTTIKLLEQHPEMSVDESNIVMHMQFGRTKPLIRFKQLINN
jgi:hypothetical protein